MDFVGSETNLIRLRLNIVTNLLRFDYPRREIRLKVSLFVLLRALMYKQNQHFKPLSEILLSFLIPKEADVLTDDPIGDCGLVCNEYRDLAVSAISAIRDLPWSLVWAQYVSSMEMLALPVAVCTM